MSTQRSPKHRPRASNAPRVTVDDFRNDKLYPRIAKAVAAVLARTTIVAPVDVLIEMQLLTRDKLEDWRAGRVPYLERVIHANLSRLSRILRILRMHAHELNLVPSETAYMSRGRRRHRLQFSKTGDPGVEAAYSCHLRWPGKGPFHPPRPGPEERPADAAAAGDGTS